MVGNRVSFEILCAVVVTIEHAHHCSVAFDDDVMGQLNASADHVVENDNDRRKTEKNRIQKMIEN